MFTNSASKIFILLLVLAISAVSLSFVSSSKHAGTSDRSYDVVDGIHAHRFGAGNSYVSDRSYAESKEQILREYQLGERYGVTPGQYAHDQALREYWLGERYVQTPRLWSGESFLSDNGTPDAKLNTNVQSACMSVDNQPQRHGGCAE